MRFLTPSRRTDLGAARHDLIEALKNYVESERVDPRGSELFREHLRDRDAGHRARHAMTLAPDAVRYLKAVLTAEAMVRELDPGFDLRAHENRFFARLMQMEISRGAQPRPRGAVASRCAASGSPACWIGRELVRETPAQLVAVAQRVRRRVQILSAFTIARLGRGADRDVRFARPARAARPRLFLPRIALAVGVRQPRVDGRSRSCRCAGCPASRRPASPATRVACVEVADGVTQ